MTDPRAARIMDALINLWLAGGRPFPCYGATAQALDYIWEAYALHQIPISLVVTKEMQKRNTRTCEHPGIVMRTEEVYDGPMPNKATGCRMWYECAKCGDREAFRNFTILTVHEYNRKRGFKEEGA